MCRRRCCLAGLTLSLLMALGAPPAQATFPGRNGKIVFDGGSGITLMNPDGTGAEVVASGSEPSFSADGRRIAYVREVITGGGRFPEGYEQVMVAHADGTHARGVTPAVDGREAQGPSFSPDGRKIAYVESYGTIWVIGTNGKHAKKLVSGSAAAFEDPEFSPNGRRIVVTSFGDRPWGNGAFQLVVIDLRTGRIKPLTKTDWPITNSDPSWSPTGRRILFTRTCPGRKCEEGGGVYVMRANGRQIRNISSRRTCCELEPAWSPDGKLIVSSDEHGIGVRRPVLRSDPRYISDDFAFDLSWGPAPKR